MEWEIYTRKLMHFNREHNKASDDWQDKWIDTLSDLEQGGKVKEKRINLGIYWDNDWKGILIGQVNFQKFMDSDIVKKHEKYIGEQTIECDICGWSLDYYYSFPHEKYHTIMKEQLRNIKRVHRCVCNPKKAIHFRM